MYDRLVGGEMANGMRISSVRVHFSKGKEKKCAKERKEEGEKKGKREREKEGKRNKNNINAIP